MALERSHLRLGESVLDKADVGDGGSECVFCLVDMKVGDLAVVLGCGHYFHLACLKSWITNDPTCPVCKQPAFQSSRYARRKQASRDAHARKVARMREHVRQIEEEERKQKRKGREGGATAERKQASTEVERWEERERISKEKMGKLRRELGLDKESHESKKQQSSSFEHSRQEVISLMVRGLSVSELRERISLLLGVKPTIQDKSVLMASLADACGGINTFRSLSVRELKTRLAAMKVNYNAVERDDLVQAVAIAVDTQIATWVSQQQI